MSLRTTWATEETLSHKTSKNLIHKRETVMMEKLIYLPEQKNGEWDQISLSVLFDRIDNKDTQLGL